MPNYTANAGFDRQIDFYLARTARRYSDSFSALSHAAAQSGQRRQQEKAILSLISQGDIQGLRELIRRAGPDLFSLRVGVMSYNNLQQTRYTMVSAVTLYCRAAVDAGVPERIAYGLSDSMIQTVDELDGPAAVAPFLCAAMLTFTDAVHRRRFTGGHPTIRQCHEYIIAHLHEPIRLTRLAQECGRNPQYLSDLFQKELGVRPGAYIRRCKLQFSLEDLAYTQERVAAIADTYAFPSASAFCAQFKAAYGMTPQHYRKLLAAGGPDGRPIPEPGLIPESLMEKRNQHGS